MARPPLPLRLARPPRLGLVLTTGVASAIAAAALVPALQPAAAGDEAGGTGDRPVVLELFTSEGCSSCPPAESLLNRVDDHAEVVALAFHVDYWDRLGWTDRFASPEASARQRRYARRLEAGRTYTPNLVVNGRDSFVGSDARSLRNALERGPGSDVRPARLPVTVTLDDQAARVAFTPPHDAAFANAHVLFAVTENGLHTDVVRGENRGERLEHDAVVRTFRVAPAAEGSAISFGLPADLDPARAHGVVLLTDGPNGPVLAAGRAPLLRP